MKIDFNYMITPTKFALTIKGFKHPDEKRRPLKA